MPAQSWSPSSWRNKPIEQVPAYPDPFALGEVKRQLSGFPPLVFADEARDFQPMMAPGFG